MYIRTRVVRGSSLNSEEKNLAYYGTNEEMEAGMGRKLREKRSEMGDAKGGEHQDEKKVKSQALRKARGARVVCPAPIRLQGGSLDRPRIDDVRNAFNSAGWSRIEEKLRIKNFSPYLINIVLRYLWDRKVHMGRLQRQLNAGMPGFGPRADAFNNSVRSAGLGGDASSEDTGCLLLTAH
ncbi:hypothetical protein NQ315_002791 [Exocentrus adspersus]|uniref:Uncharacterized protein n=1 Tax=Exocentrus adspersus TaxID=1586481 RepID=A0AAV8VJU8_9CUCU|nr:hypothetical protein NQ315_002791 [Exocentrus adspersus]